MARSAEWCSVHSTPLSECERLGTLQEGRCYAPPRMAVDDQPDLPDAGMSPAEATGIEFKMVYDANLKAGFSEMQSLYLLGCQITGSPGIAPPEAMEPPTTL